MLKKRYVFLIIIVCLFTISTASANEMVNKTNDNLDIDIISINEKMAVEQEDLLNLNEGTFSELASEINGGGNVLLSKSLYKYNNGSTTIEITKSGIIDGNGAIIDMNGSTIRAFYVSTSGVTIKNLTIINANSDVYGGAISFSSLATSSTVSNCNFVNNTASGWGGAIMFSGTGTVSNCNFVDNKATGNYQHGGAVYFRNVGEVTNCNFTGNNATGDGGAVYFSNNGTVTNCNFTGNNATGDGGAVYFRNVGEVTNCNFINNKATGTDSVSGAIYSNQQYTTADTCIFKRNSGYNLNTVIYPPTLNVNNFTTVYGSGEKLTFDLKTNSNISVTNGNISISVYFKGNGEWVRNYTCLSGEGWIPDLPVGSYIAFFDTEYAEFQEINRTITITAPEHTFWFLNYTINGNDNPVIELSHDFYFDPAYDAAFVNGIVINRPVTIKGNGNAIDANRQARIFYVQSANAVLENLTIKNANYNGHGGAIYFSSLATSGTVSNCNFVDNKATGDYRYGGAVYFDETGNVTNCNFTGNTATRDGGAVYFSTGTVTNCNFTGNTATDDFARGGAVYFSTGTVTNCTFTDNTARYGGAVYFSTGTVTNCNFTGNNATYGSAIFFNGYGYAKTISNSIFLNNRANAESLEIIKNDNNITITFTGKDNLLNAIYSPDKVTFTNVTYWGAKGITTVSATMSESNKAAGQNISVGVVVNDKIVLNEVMITKEDGMIVLNINAGDNYYITARHDADSYYTEAEKTISNNTKFNVNVTSKTTNNKTVNITAKSNIYSEVMPGKLLFILLDGTAYGMVIEANYSGNGTWWAKYTFADYGEYKVNATYVGLDNVTINNGTITINKVNSTITLDDVTLDYGESKNVTVTTTGATGIKANINGTNVTVINNYTILISDLAAGNYTLTVTTIPDKDYNPVTATSKITINKVESTLTVDNIEFDYNSEGSCDVSFTGASQVIANVVNQPSAVVSVNGKKITVSGLAAGTYTLNVTTVPDENHTAVTETAEITVNKINSTLTLEDVELDYGESKNITVAAEGATGITAKIDGVNVTVNGYTIPISGLGAGNYTLSVTTISDDNHNPVTKEVNITVNKLSTEIILANETLDLKVGDDVPVLVNLTPAGAGNLTFTSSDEDLVFVEDNVTIVANSQGQAIITVSFAGNENYTAAENKTITVNVVLNDASVSVDNDTLDLKVGETCAINATIEPDTILLHIKYASSNESVATVDKNGIVTAVGEGTAIITLEVGDNEIYAKNSTTVTVNVKDNTVNVSASDLTKYYNGSESFVVTVTDSKNNPLANQSVIINVAGVNYTRTTDANGTASIAISLISGQYNVTTIVNNNTVYSKITVLPTVNATDLVKVFRNETQFYATFKDSQGNYLAEGTMVRFNINGVMYDRKISGNNGLAKLNINLEQGQYIITSMNLETGENAANNVTVISRLIENKDITKYYRNGTQYTVKVIGDDGNAVGTGEIVTFNVNGVLYNRTTNESGIAKLNINLHPGDYIITAEYKDCRVSNNIKVLPVLTADDLTKKYGTPDQFIATLVDGQGNPFAGETVQFNVNGIFYNRVTDSNGQSKLNIRLMPGKYVITSSYNGTNIANTITISA